MRGNLTAVDDGVASWLLVLTTECLSSPQAESGARPMPVPMTSSVPARSRVGCSLHSLHSITTADRDNSCSRALGKSVMQDTAKQRVQPSRLTATLGIALESNQGQHLELLKAESPFSRN